MLKLGKAFSAMYLKEIECLTPKKRKHILFFDRARLIFQLNGTDFYLIYVIPGAKWNRKSRKYIDSYGGWYWYRVKKDHIGVMKSIEVVELYDIMEDLDLPVEILFHIDTLRKLDNLQ